MADDKTKPAAKKPNPAIFIGIVLVVLVALGIAQFSSQVNENTGNIEQATEEQAGTETTDEAAAGTTTPEEAVAAAASSATIDVNAALSDRILGNPSAPVKISEHASFTCGHCGQFHRDTFDQVKKEYIDTGKAYLVFSDFPLNAPAVHASMVARCLPVQAYFDFVSLLFEKQEEWAYDANYLDFLKAEAGKAGLDEARFQACVQNKELQEGIVNRMKGVAAQWNISSTPSFVINNRTTISGAYPFEEFKKTIEAELSGQQSTAPSSPGATESVDEPAEEASEEPAAEETDVEPAAAEENTDAEDAPAETESEESGTTQAE